MVGNINGGVGPVENQQITSQEVEKPEEIQQQRIEQYSKSDEEIKENEEQTEKLDDATLKPAEVVEEMDYKAAETLQEVFTAAIDAVPESKAIKSASDEIPDNTVDLERTFIPGHGSSSESDEENGVQEAREDDSSDPDSAEAGAVQAGVEDPEISLEGAGVEGRVTIERAVEEDGGPKTEDREAIIDSNDGTSREAIIDSNDGTSRINTGPDLDGVMIIDSNDGSSTVGIIDSNDGISAEAIIDSNDTNLITGEQNPALAEPPTWSEQMDQGRVDDADLHAPDGMADPDEIGLQMPDSMPSPDEIDLQMPDSKPGLEDQPVQGRTAGQIMEEEEPVQGITDHSLVMEEEEPVQGRTDSQLMEEEEPVQGLTADVLNEIQDLEAQMSEADQAKNQQAAQVLQEQMLSAEETPDLYALANKAVQAQYGELHQQESNTLVAIVLAKTASGLTADMTSSASLKNEMLSEIWEYTQDSDQQFIQNQMQHIQALIDMIKEMSKIQSQMNNDTNIMR